MNRFTCPRIRRHTVVLGLLLLAGAPLSARAADTGGGSVNSVAPAPAPLSLGNSATTTPGATISPAATKPDTSKSVDTLLAEARSSIAAKKWTDAITILKTAAAAEPSNADVQNLLGYSNRNNGDYSAALNYYSAALSINPNHRGALEYQGVAFLKIGEPAKAKANLARLKKICGVSCEEYKDLARAIKTGSPKKTARIAKP